MAERTACETPDESVPLRGIAAEFFDPDRVQRFGLRFRNRGRFCRGSSLQWDEIGHTKSGDAQRHAVSSFCERYTDAKSKDGPSVLGTKGQRQPQGVGQPT